MPPLQDELPAGAFISPDEPIRRTPGEVPDDAFISPDEPIRHRAPLPGRSTRDARGTVTGIGSADPSYYRSVTSLANDVRDVDGMGHVLDELSKRIREDGAAALFVEPGISGFEASLRGFLAGYLARTRAEG